MRSKRMVLFLAGLWFSVGVKAQTWEEWFEQKKTQLRYLAEQIAALKTYGVAVRNGYDLAKEGLGAIAERKAGDLLLHREHFSSLYKIKQGLKEEGPLPFLIARQTRIQSIGQECRKRLAADGLFTADEQVYFLRVCTNVLQNSAAVAAEAELLTTDGAYGMSDDERMARLQALTTEMEDLYTFSLHFSDDMTLLALNRSREKRDNKAIRALY